GVQPQALAQLVLILEVGVRVAGVGFEKLDECGPDENSVLHAFHLPWYPGWPGGRASLRREKIPSRGRPGQERFATGSRRPRSGWSLMFLTQHGEPWSCKPM